MNKRAAAIAATGAALIATLSACDTGPECAQYETQTHLVTHIVNGKMVTGMVTSTVCVRYKEPAK
jgi:hypothetical protein